MRDFFVVISFILAILGFPRANTLSEKSFFGETSSLSRTQPAQQTTSQSLLPIRTMKQQPSQPPHLQPRTPDVQITRLRHTTVSQPWKQAISILESSDSESYRYHVLSNLKDRLPSRISSGELTSIQRLFDSEAYRYHILSNLKDRLPSRISSGELTSIQRLFDSEAYRVSHSI